FSEIEGTFQEGKAAVDAGIREMLLALRFRVDEFLNVLLGERFGQPVSKPRTEVTLDFVFSEFQVEAVQSVVRQDSIQEVAYSGFSWPFEARHTFCKPQLGFFLVAGESRIPNLLSSLRIRHPPDGRIGPSIQSHVINNITFWEKWLLSF
ncbi:MAG TPA: hypothetical protein VMH05_17165, partial [Bryobacteraceae bacterium]|nr:hypothetical protein [Bryobacteraceae bacterium]